MQTNREGFELVEADENTVQEISQLNTSADDMTHYLSGLSQKQMDEIQADPSALETLYSAILSSAELPQKTFAAKAQGGKTIGYVAVKGYGQQEPELQIEVAPEYQKQGYGHEMLHRTLHLVFKNTGVSTILYRTRPDNYASIRLITSCGGLLQTPASKAEEHLLKTYHVEDYVFAHDFCINHRRELSSDRRCACFFCQTVFKPSEINEWIEDTSGTAICPYCGIDSVIGESSGFLLTPAFLENMNNFWF